MNQKYGWMAIGLIGFTTACGGGGFGGDSPSYSGKIVDWPAAKTGSAKASISVPNSPPVTGQPAAIDVNGNFSNLTFPSGSNVTLSAVTTPCAAAAWSPATVKVGNGSIAVFNNTNAAAGSIVEGTKNFGTSGNNVAVGDKQVLRIYVDTNATLKGTCIFGNPSSTNIYDANLTAGWNVVILEVTKVSGTTVTEVKATSGSLPSDSKLFYSVGANPLSLNLFKLNLFK